MVHVGHHGVGIYCELSLRVYGWRWLCGGDKTHVKDVEDSVEVQLPGDGGFLVTLRVCKSSQPIPPAFLNDLLLDSCHGPAIKDVVSSCTQYSVCRNRWLDSRCQLSNRFVHRLAELAHSPPVHPPIKRSTYIRTGKTEFDVVQFVDHRVLATYKHGTFGPGRRRTYPDHGEQDADGAKNSLGWCETRDLLRKIHGFDG